VLVRRLYSILDRPQKQDLEEDFLKESQLQLSLSPHFVKMSPQSWRKTANEGENEPNCWLLRRRTVSVWLILFLPLFLALIIRLFSSLFSSTQLYGNPFHCDCRLLDFARWVQSSKVPRTAEPLCRRPNRLENRSVAGEIHWFRYLFLATRGKTEMERLFSPDNPFASSSPFNQASC